MYYSPENSPDLPRLMALSTTELTRPLLGEMFDVLEVPRPNLDNLQELTEQTQPWVKGDYTRPLHNFELTDAKRQKLRAIFSEVGMMRPWELEGEEIDHIVLLGCVHPENVTRLDFLRYSMLRGGITPATITLLGGERPIFPESEADPASLMIESLKKAQKGDAWLDAISQQSIENYDETDLVRMAFLDRLGPLALKAMYLHVGLEPSGRKPIDRYEFSWQGVPLTLLHTRPVARKGESRHTTEACLDDWLHMVNPAENSRVAVVGSQPHLQRLSYTVPRLLARKGRSDLRASVVGPAALPSTQTETYLKEVAQTIYEMNLRASGETAKAPKGAECLHPAFGHE